MSEPRRDLWIVVAVAAALLALVLAIVALAASSGRGMMSRDRDRGYGMMNGSRGYGPGMMGGSSDYGPGMMSGEYGLPATSRARSASVTDLNAVRGRTNAWLKDHGFDGYRAAEVMAFTNNDYVVVEDSSGHAAFELLSGPRGQWLVPEPGPNMIWNTRYGMMRGSGRRMMDGYGPGMMGGFGANRSSSRSAGAISPARARAIAGRWLNENLPGQKPLDPNAFPGYYTIDFGRAEHPSGMLSVNASSGAVWYHSWHGRFLAEQDADKPARG